MPTTAWPGLAERDRRSNQPAHLLPWVTR